jgi:hypothetical protein
VYFPSVMLMALHEERVRDAERPAWGWLWRGRARGRLALSPRTRAGSGQAALLAAGAKS